jgi:hypothetical protein
MNFWLLVWIISIHHIEKCFEQKLETFTRFKCLHDEPFLRKSFNLDLGSLNNIGLYLTDTNHSFHSTTFSVDTDSSVGIALGFGLDDRDSRVRFPAGAGNFYLHHLVRNGLRPTQPPIQWVPGALFLELKWLGREADPSPPSSAEVKGGAVLPLPQYAIMALCSVEAQGQLYL